MKEIHGPGMAYETGKAWGIIPWKIIYGCNHKPLFKRYFLCTTPLFGVMVHQFYRSDEDRDLHDHPWNFLTLILRGGYWEETRVKNGDTGLVAAHYRATGEILDQVCMTWRNPGEILYRPATFKHAVRLQTGTEGKVWTLVIKSKRVREWGFWTREGWVDWKTYGKKRTCE